MSYLTQAGMADDADLRRRVTACAALEHIPDPERFAYDRRWELSAQPDWDEAYASAVARDVVKPGADSSVISDGMILSAVQLLKPEPDPAI